MGEVVAWLEVLEKLFIMPYIDASNNDQVQYLKNRVNVFRDIVDTLESNPDLANSSTKTLVDLTKALKETEKFLRKYSELQDTRSGQFYSYCLCYYKAEFIKDLMGRLNQCAADLGLQQIIDTRVDAADMIQHVLKEFVDQSALSDKERETLRTDMERYFLELTAQLGEIENKSASDLKEIFTKEVKEKLIDANSKLDQMIFGGGGITTIIIIFYLLVYFIVLLSVSILNFVAYDVIILILIL